MPVGICIHILHVFHVKWNKNGICCAEMLRELKELMHMQQRRALGQCKGLNYYLQLLLLFRYLRQCSSPFSPSFDQKKLIKWVYGMPVTCVH